MKSYAYLFKKAWQNYKIAESEPQLTNCAPLAHISFQNMCFAGKPLILI